MLDNTAQNSNNGVKNSSADTADTTLPDTTFAEEFGESMDDDLADVSLSDLGKDAGDFLTSLRDQAVEFWQSQAKPQLSQASEQAKLALSHANTELANQTQKLNDLTRLLKKPEHVPFAITHVSIVDDLESSPDQLDMRRNKVSVYPDQTIVVGADGKIEEIGDSASIEPALPQGYRRLDATGKFAIPGLINLHVHTFSNGKPLQKMTSKDQTLKMRRFFDTKAGREAAFALSLKNIETMLRSGVTTLRTLGDLGDDAIRVSKLVEEGRITGPRILASGPIIAAVGGHGAPLISTECADEADAAVAVDRNIAMGASAIKVASTGGVTDSTQRGEAGAVQLTEGQMAIICEIAHEHGLLVAAHAQSLDGVKNALRAGVDTIEHGSELDDEAIALFKNNPKALHGFSSFDATVLAGVTMRDLPQSVTQLDDIPLANGTDITNGMLAGLKQAKEAGIVVSMGTDSAMPLVTQYGTWRELEVLMKYADYTAAEALYTATHVNAGVLGLGSEIGTLREGYSADIVITDENPLENLSTLDDVELVVAHGLPVFRPQVKKNEEIERNLDMLG